MDLSAECCRIGVVTSGDGVTILVEGEIDLDTAPLLQTALAGVDGHPVEVNLSAMTFVDAAGLRVLETARTRLGSRMRVTGAAPLVRRLAAVLDLPWLDADIGP
jgi:anti-anti-sigma factor